MNTGIISQAKIINFDTNSEAICASAARISTTKGNAIDIFENAKGNISNQDLIKKVLKSGHKSFIEHAVFTISLCNVSAFVEQFFIECRLASFTIKSRRYVDFSKSGYYIPSDLTTENKILYCKYMDKLFEAYQTLIENGVPKEDARFLLPYSFNSNFYCTINARELSHLLHAMKYGRGRSIPELRILADQLAGQIETLFPCLVSEFEYPCNELCSLTDDANVHDPISFIESREIGAVSLVDFPSVPFEKLMTAYRIKNCSSTLPFDINSLLNSERPRELEQIAYTFLISNVTLSGITHIVRHRMQSIIIPPIQTVNHNKYIVPRSIHGKLLEYYKQVLEQANVLVKQFCTNPQLSAYHYYYALSGNVMDIMTTMNARELKTFIELRSCNRAQWEVRDISIKMLKQLRAHFPELFNNFGPSCYTKGSCPEGRLSCGNMNNVIYEFRELR